MIFKILCLVLVVLLVLKSRSSGKKKTNDFFFPLLAKSRENFYYKDLEGNTEIFSMRIGEKEFYSLQDFLKNFKNGNKVLMLVNEKNQVEYVNLEDTEFFFKAKICTNNECIFILFLDCSEQFCRIKALSLDLQEVTEKVNLLQETLDMSPFILYAESKTRSVASQIYKENAEFIKSGGDEYKVDLPIKDKNYQITKVKNGGHNFIFGFENTDLKDARSSTALYERSIQFLLEYIKDPVFIVNGNMKIVAKNNAAFKKMELCDEVVKNLPKRDKVFQAELIKVKTAKAELSVNLIPYAQQTIVIVKC